MWYQCGTPVKPSTSKHLPGEPAQITRQRSGSSGSVSRSSSGNCSQLTRNDLGAHGGRGFLSGVLVGVGMASRIRAGTAGIAGEGVAAGGASPRFATMNPAPSVDLH